MEGYYRKAGVNASDDDPCTPCHCNSIGSIGIDCVKVTIITCTIVEHSVGIGEWY